MLVKVNLFANMREIAGKTQVTCEIEERATIRQLINKMIEIYGERMKEQFTDYTGKLSEQIIILNGNILRLEQNTDRELKDGDEVSFIVPFEGG